MKNVLAYPPEDERDLELWMQHVAGHIIFKDVREYAIKQIPVGTNELDKEKILSGIDNAIYGFMMIMDGVTGSFENEEYSVKMNTIISLDKDGETIQELNTFNGDGMCMGFHMWKDGDFGDDPILK